jgi:SAM-dependent methyltransferase
MSDRDSQEQLLHLLSGKWLTAAISTAAELGIADQLTAGPLTAAELAVRCRCDEQALKRLLRVLCGESLLELGEDARYHLTDLGRQLCDGELRTLARFVGAPFMWNPWTALSAQLKDPSRSAFERTHGSTLFEYLDADPHAAGLYHAAVDAFTRRQARALCDAFDFSQLERIVDVGGGLGTVLTELTQRYPTLRCVLYDRPSVIEQAHRALGTAPHIEPMAGDFFSSVPAPADAYLIKHVLHNWDDEHALRLLRACRAGLRPGGRVLIVESLRLPGNVRDATALMDLEMLVLCGGGYERSKPEFRRLLGQAGLSLQATRTLVAGVRLLVAVPRVPRDV